MAVSTDVMEAVPGIWADAEEDLPDVHTKVDELEHPADPEGTTVDQELPAVDPVSTTVRGVPAVPEATTEAPVVLAGPEATIVVLADPADAQEAVEPVADVQAVDQAVDPVVDPVVSTALQAHHRQVEARNSIRPRKHTINIEKSRRSSTIIHVRNR